MAFPLSMSTIFISMYVVLKERQHLSAANLQRSLKLDLSNTWTALLVYHQSEKSIFRKYFFNIDISLSTKEPDLKFEICIHQIYMQGSVSQIFHLGPSFFFMDSRKLNKKKIQKVSRFFT